jgi:hypothetical protein
MRLAKRGAPDRARHGGARPNLERQSMCRKDHDKLPRLTEICADDAEVLALSVLRFVAAGYMTSDVACWDAAYDGAERLLGVMEGPPLVAAMTRVMRAIRSERQRDWHFMPATCCRVTEDEHQLIALLASARRRHQAEVMARAARLTGLSDAPRLTAAVSAAAEMLDATQPRLRPATAIPAQAVLH